MRKRGRIEKPLCDLFQYIYICRGSTATINKGYCNLFKINNPIHSLSTHNIFYTGCLLNIVFFSKILKYSGLLSFSVSSVSLCIRTRFVIRSGVELVLSHEYSLRNREKDRSPLQLVTGKLKQADKSNKSS